VLRLVFETALLCFLIGQRLSIFREYVDPFFGLAAYFFVGGSFYLYRDKIAYRSDFALAAGLCLFIALFSWRASTLALALLGGYLLFYIAFRPIKILANFGKLPDVSYGVYLYAFPIQKLMYWYAPSISPWLVFVAAGLLSLILGAMSWYAIEKPFLSLKRLGQSEVQVSS
jgi:peptidoglycan/LPS O-acetylase OafA/YrhL